MCRSFKHREHKGQVGTIFVVIVLIFGTMMLLGIEALLATNIVAIKNTIAVNIETSDRGTELLSLMMSKTSAETYIVLLGEMVAYNAPAGLGDGIKATLDKIHSAYEFTLQYSGMSDKRFSKGDSSGEDDYRMQIPVPGARPGKTKAYASLER